MTHPYATLAYAGTLAHVGQPLYVPPWRTHVIVREWRTGVHDAAGTYPVACLDANSDISAGLDLLRDTGLVSIVLVVDGLAGPGIERLSDAFPLARPWKTHYVVDPSVAAYAPSSHHAYEIRRAVRRGLAARVVPLGEILDQWCSLYAILSEHRAIAGAARFTRDAFERLARCEGFVTVAAFGDAGLASCHIFAVDEGYAISHLAATSPWGYANGAAYLVEDVALRELGNRVVNLGGTAGISRRRERRSRQIQGRLREPHAAIVPFRRGARRERLCLPDRGTDTHRFLPGVPRVDRQPRRVTAQRSWSRQRPSRCRRARARPSNRNPHRLATARDTRFEGAMFASTRCSFNPSNA